MAKPFDPFKQKSFMETAPDYASRMMYWDTDNFFAQGNRAAFRQPRPDAPMSMLGSGGSRVRQETYRPRSLGIQRTYGSARSSGGYEEAAVTSLATNVGRAIGSAATMPSRMREYEAEKYRAVPLSQAPAKDPNDQVIKDWNKEALLRYNRKQASLQRDQSLQEAKDQTSPEFYIKTPLERSRSLQRQRVVTEQQRSSEQDSIRDRNVARIDAQRKAAEQRRAAADPTSTTAPALESTSTTTPPQQPLRRAASPVVASPATPASMSPGPSNIKALSDQAKSANAANAASADDEVMIPFKDVDDDPWNR